MLIVLCVCSKYEKLFYCHEIQKAQRISARLIGEIAVHTRNDREAKISYHFDHMKEQRVRVNTAIQQCTLAKIVSEARNLYRK